MQAAWWENGAVLLCLMAIAWIVTARLARDRPPPGATATVSALLASLAERSRLFGSLWQRTETVRTRFGSRMPAWANDLGIVVALSVLLMSLWVAVEVIEDVVTQDTEIDARVAAAIGSPSAVPTEIAVLVSTATSPRATALVAVCVLSFLVWKRRRIEAIGLFLSVGGTAVWTSILKAVFDRTRPPGVDIYHPHGMAFPSGHTSGTVALYLFLAWLMTRQDKGWARIWPWLAAVCITAVVGASRIYLAVHWVTDVLGAAALTTAWVLLCVLWTRRLLARQLHRRGVPAAEADAGRYREG